jgi:hypothetical protein
MALHLVRRIAGDTVAQAIQVGMEYDPQPPFDGNAGRMPAQVREILTASGYLRTEENAAPKRAPA